MNIAITIVHNKTAAENAAQIEALLPLITIVTDLHTDPETKETFETYHYEITGLPIQHEARFYQIVPFGVKQPANFYSLDSYNVIYGKGDEDKTGDHPRFFNWGLKRGVDHGADLSLFLDDPSALTQLKLKNALNKVVKDSALVETPWGKIATKQLLTEVGQLKEDRSRSAAMTELKTRVAEKGMEIN